MGTFDHHLKTKSREALVDDGIQWRPRDFDWRDVSLTALEEIDCPRSLSVAIMLRYGEHVQLAGLVFDPFAYGEFIDAIKAFQATELLRKFQGLEGTTGESRRTAAIAKAAEAERQCAQTNIRVNGWEHGIWGNNPSVERAVKLARKKISRVLGQFSMDEWMDACKWGPGTDAMNKRPFVSAYHKFKNELSFTWALRPISAFLLEGSNLWSRWLSGVESPGWFTPIGILERGNRFTTVLKTALIDRSICIEPGFNCYMQLGLGKMIRRRLRRFGIDLNTQDWNQWLALWGSETNHIATIDLSSASDTIARKLVQFLLADCPLWLAALEKTRCLFTNWGTKKKPSWLPNSKFSSMGNGFTFELETLIFWALSSSAAELSDGHCLATYGDDIIVDSHSYQSVVDVLSECGFQTNVRKSYNASNYRESCGMNAWNGLEMPVYRHTVLTENVQHLYSMINGLRRIGCNRAASKALRAVPKNLRFYGPSSLGDIVLCNPDVTTWSGQPYGLVDQWFFWGYRIKCLQHVPGKVQTKELEPSILHSFATMVPTADHPIYVGGRWGGEGLATLTTGTWTVGEALTSRETTSVASASFDAESSS